MAINRNNSFETGDAFVYAGLGAILKQAEDNKEGSYDFSNDITKYLISSLKNILDSRHRNYGLEDNFDLSEIQSIFKRRLNLDKDFDFDEEFNLDMEVKGGIINNPKLYVQTISSRIECLKLNAIGSLGRLKEKYNNETIKSGIDGIINDLNEEFDSDQEHATKSLDAIANRAIQFSQELVIVGKEVSDFHSFNKYHIKEGSELEVKIDDSSKIGIYRGIVFNGKIKIDFGDETVLVSPENVFPTEKENSTYLDISKSGRELRELEFTNRINITDVHKQTKLIEGQVLIDRYDGSNNLYFIRSNLTSKGDYNYSMIMKNSLFSVNINDEETEVVYTGKVNNEGIEVYLDDDRDKKLNVKLNDIVLDSLQKREIAQDIKSEYEDPNYQKSTKYINIKMLLEFSEDKEIISQIHPNIGTAALPYRVMEENIECKNIED